LRVLAPELEEQVLLGLRDVPLFARPLQGAYGRDVRATTRALVEGFVARTEGAPPRADARERAVDAGRREVRLGRDLEGLLAAYRVAARTVWRVSSGLGEELALDPRALTALGEAVLGYFDELSGAAAEGFAEERAASEGERLRRHERLVALLVREPPTDAGTLAAAAEAAGWEPPATLGALVLPADAPLRLSPDVLLAPRGELVFALVPDPDAPARRARLAGVLGPTVPWTRAAESLRRALAAYALLGAGALAPAALLVADEHLLALWLHADPEVARALAARELAPLAAVRPVVRERLRATLRAWLDHQGHQGAMAHALGVHHQTVRYRLARLRELFGPALEDPERRFALAAALRA